jgi:glycosyltransferase involved in cell wall biosynthesis
MLKVNAYTPGLNTPSGRYRVRQLIPYLEKLDISVNEIYSRAEAFPPPEKSKHLSWAIKNMQENFFKILSQPKCDITLLQRAMLSKHYTFERLLKKPLVFDVDDAIFVDNGGGFAQKIARQSKKIICGNSFLAEYFSKYNDNVEIIPTAVDVSKYDAIKIDKAEKDIFYILWTGTSSGYPFVYKIEKALKRIVTKYDFVKIKIVANEPPKFSFLTENEYVFEKWSPDIEFSSIKSSDIGIMPINDDDRSRGKCSYKMLCYMAAKIPIVVSPFGMNKEVLDMDNIGYGAITEDEWFYAFDQIISSPEKQKELSNNAYNVILKKFDINVVAKRLSKALNSVIN